MKKSILICFVLLSARGFGQNFVQGVMQRLSFGIKAGANYSNYTHADFKTDALVGFHAGAMINFKLTKNLSIQEEFLFSSQGAKVKGDLFGKEDVKVYYITVPLLLKYRTSSGIYIEAGPQAGMRANEDVGNTAIGEFAKKLDLSVAGGVGFQSKAGLGVGVRYVAGLSKVGDFQLSNVKTDFRNSVIQASIFYIF